MTTHLGFLSIHAIDSANPEEIRGALVHLDSQGPLRLSTYRFVGKAAKTNITTLKIAF
ncbi:MAG: hypothetical protein Kow00121_25420 [Elainellaceae cyanobacterium]